MLLFVSLTVSPFRSPDIFISPVPTMLLLLMSRLPPSWGVVSSTTLEIKGERSGGV